MTTTPSITSGQLKQYKRFVEDAAEKALVDAGLDKDRIQKLIGNGGEFQADILASIKRLSVADEFADEEVASSYGYLSSYTPKVITEQTNRLRELFPGIGTANEKLMEQPLPQCAEGFFAIPRWQKIANSYNDAVELVLAKLSETRSGKFYNYRNGALGPRHLRQHVRKAKLFEAVAEEQTGYDILVVPAQFGLRHRGRSVRRARVVFMGNESGLGVYENGILLLTHPERLQHYDDLWIDCAGDEYATVAVGGFSGAPLFRFGDGGLEFGARFVGSAYEICGSSSVVLLQ